MRAYSSRQEKPEDLREMKSIQLKDRQYKLQALLRDESSKFAQEAKELRVNGVENSKTLDALKHRMDSIKSAREEDRKKLAEEKLYQHWRENNPDIRQIESKRKFIEKRQTLGAIQYMNNYFQNLEQFSHLSYSLN